MKKININKSSAIKTIGALGIASTLVSGKAFGQTEKATVYALIGDSKTMHPFDGIKGALDANIVKGINVTIDYDGDNANLSASKLEGYRLLITAVGGIRDTQDEVKAKAIQAFVQNGGAALFMHNSTACARASGTPILRDIFGGHWLYHSGTTRNSIEVRPYRVKITNSNHPITQGVESNFETIGEHHYNQYDKDPRYIFMTNDTLDGWEYNDIPGDKHYDNRLGSRGYGPSCPSGWAYDYGKGRVCFMAPGHTYEEYMNAEYVKLQKNAVRWCLKQI